MTDAPHLVCLVGLFQVVVFLAKLNGAVYPFPMLFGHIKAGKEVGNEFKEWLP